MICSDQGRGRKCRNFKPPEKEPFHRGAHTRVNALTPEGQYRESLFYFGRKKTTDRGSRAVSALWESAANGQLGNALKQLCTSEHQKALLSMAESLSRAVACAENG